MEKILFEDEGEEHYLLNGVTDLEGSWQYVNGAFVRVG